MRPERRAEWLTECLMAAVENALQKAKTGRWDDAISALERVEGMATRARLWAMAARREEIVRRGQ